MLLEGKMVPDDVLDVFGLIIIGSIKKKPYEYKKKPLA